jgi:hypothetical protein
MFSISSSASASVSLAANVSRFCASSCALTKTGVHNHTVIIVQFIKCTCNYTHRPLQIILARTM